MNFAEGFDHWNIYLKVYMDDDELDFYVDNSQSNFILKFYFLWFTQFWVVQFLRLPFI